MIQSPAQISNSVWRPPMVRRSFASSRGQTGERWRRRRIRIALLFGLIALWMCFASMAMGSLSLSVESSNNKKRPAPTVQVFVVTSPAHEANMQRLQSNNAWHSLFPDLKVFTFDQIDESSDESSYTIKPLELMEGEASAKDSNLLSAAFQEIYSMNQESDWYLLTEDDTIIVKENLDRLVDELNDIGYADKEVMLGRCMGDNAYGRDYPLIVGGSGILMSRALLQKLVPMIPVCRQKYQRGWGDARLGGCIFFDVNISMPTDEVCKASSLGYSFMNGPAASMVKTERPEDLIVALHEKDPFKIMRYNSVIRYLTNQGLNVTWGSMAPYLNAATDSSS